MKRPELKRICGLLGISIVIITFSFSLAKPDKPNKAQISPRQFASPDASQVLGPRVGPKLLAKNDADSTAGARENRPKRVFRLLNDIQTWNNMARLPDSVLSALEKLRIKSDGGKDGGRKKFFDARTWGGTATQDRLFQAVLRLTVFLHDRLPMQAPLLALLEQFRDLRHRQMKIEAFRLHEESLLAKREQDPEKILRTLTGGREDDIVRLLQTLGESELESPRIRAALRELALHSRSQSLRKRALDLHRNRRDEDTARFLMRQHRIEPDPDVRNAAVRALATMNRMEVSRFLLDVLENDSSAIPRRHAASGLGSQDYSVEVGDSLVDAYHGDPDWMVRYQAVSSMAAHADQLPIGEQLIWIVQNDPSPKIRMSALQAIPRTNQRNLSEFFNSIAKNDDDQLISEIAAHLSTQWTSRGD